MVFCLVQLIQSIKLYIGGLQPLSDDWKITHARKSKPKPRKSLITVSSTLKRAHFLPHTVAYSDGARLNYAPH